MTPQDETSAAAETSTATDEPGLPPGQQLQFSGQQGTAQPLPPSPYLDGGSMPQAYLAPPQPGQPKYGAPPASRPGRRQFGSAGSGPGRQATGQSGFQQPGYERPGGGSRRAFGPQALRDPVIAAPWERLAASVLDWIVIFGIATVTFISPLLRIWRQLQAVATQYTNLNSPGAQAAVNGIARDPSNQRALLFWFLAMFGIALGYYWIQHAAWGATLGKRALGTRVVTAADRSAIGIRAAGIRTVSFLVGPVIFLLLVSPLNIPGGLLWAADTAMTLLDPRAQCLHDKLAGTIVIRQRWLDQQAGRASRR